MDLIICIYRVDPEAFFTVRGVPWMMIICYGAFSVGGCCRCSYYSHSEVRTTAGLPLFQTFHLLSTSVLISD